MPGMRALTPPQTELVSVGNINKFSGTTGAPPSNGNGTPTVERDHLFDAGTTQQVIPGLNIGIDAYYKKAADLIDEGQFGPALNLKRSTSQGTGMGREFTGSYTHENVYLYENFAYWVVQGTQVESGRFSSRPTNSSASIATTSFSITIRPSPIPPGSFTMANGCSASTGSTEAGSEPGSLIPEICHFISLDSDPGVPLPNNGGVLEFRGAIVNLADHTYLVRNGTGVGVFANQFGPRRALYGGIKREFPFSKPAGTQAPMKLNSRLRPTHPERI